MCVGIVGRSADVTHNSAVAYPGSDVCVKKPAKSAKLRHLSQGPWVGPTDIIKAFKFGKIKKATDSREMLYLF